MTDEERRGLEISGRLSIGRGSIALVAALSGIGGMGIGWLGNWVHVVDEATAVRLESCEYSENQCSEQIVKYERFAEQVIPYLEADERGRSIAAQARLPRHLRFKTMGDKE